jgi:hypothetical protein
MASIRKELEIGVSAAEAWPLLQPAEAHKAFKPVLSEARLDNGIRTATFANGMVVHEQILDVDNDHRRVAYAVKDAPGVTYHHATMELVERGPGRCHFIWITDFVPAEAASTIGPLVEAGAAALKANLEGR